MNQDFTVCLVSLGCEKNTCDSEKMLHILAERGYRLTDDPEEADAAVVNTCCFIQSATEESLDTLFELASLKQGRLQFLVAAGCMAERFKNEIMSDLPEVDAFIGTASLSAIADVLDRLRGETETSEPEPRAETEESESTNKDRSNGKVTVYHELDHLAQDLGNVKRAVSQRPYTAYLKIADGCDKRCTYCAIPLFKGSFHSVPMENLLQEAKELVQNGARELILVAQETSGYGKDLYGEKSLHILLKKLAEISDLHWIRLLYVYPEELYPELIREMAENPKVLHYLDLPLQHTESDILRRMGRRVTKEDVYRIINNLRKAMPDITLRTTLITGFPGETEEEYAALLETLRELSFDHLGVFAYSQEEGTAAAGFPDQIPEEIKEERKEAIMLLQQEIAQKNKEKLIGEEMEILIEGYLPDEGVYVGRTQKDAPDVDGLVFLTCNHDLISGSFVRGRVTDASCYDLYAEIVEELE